MHSKLDNFLSLLLWISFTFLAFMLYTKQFLSFLAVRFGVFAFQHLYAYLFLRYSQKIAIDVGTHNCMYWYLTFVLGNIFCFAPT